MWFAKHELEIKYLSYENIDKKIVNFNNNIINNKLISVTEIGDHAGCPAVFYNVETGETRCLYHEFLEITNKKESS